MVFGIDDAALATMVSAGASIGGSILGANSAMKSQDIANAKNIQMLHDQQDWNEYMTRHAHQFEVEDLRKAGLNPILSATGGSGASYSGVSSPTIQPIVSPNTASIMADSPGKVVDLLTSIAGLRTANAHAAYAEKETARFTEDGVPKDTKLWESVIYDLLKNSGIIGDIKNGAKGAAAGGAKKFIGGKK